MNRKLVSVNSAIRAITLAACACMTIGCANPKDTAIVMGVVTVDGKPLNAGTVIFKATDPQSRVQRVKAPIGNKGDYQYGGVPVGTLMVGVSVTPIEPPANADYEKWKARYDAKQKEIGEHYADPQTSGITIEVKPGEQEHDIELKSSGS